MARLLKPKTIETVANRIVRLYWAEYRLPGGDWQRIDPGWQVTIGDKPAAGSAEGS